MKGERPFIHLSKIFDGFRFDEPIALVGKILCYAIKLSALLFIADNRIRQRTTNTVSYNMSCQEPVYLIRRGLVR